MAAHAANLHRGAINMKKSAKASKHSSKLSRAKNIERRRPLANEHVAPVPPPPVK